jgi:flagellar biosynthesis protein FlhF
MQLRTFTAPSIADAMQMVRDALGPDAMILSSQRNGRKGVSVTAAAQRHERPVIEQAGDAAGVIAVLDAIGSTLDFHGLPPVIADRLMGLAADAPSTDIIPTLSHALGRRIRFQPIDPVASSPIMLVGLPGAGKTSCLAKLAARARLLDQTITAITCDTESAGAVEQLATYTRLLEIPAFRAKDQATLARALEAARKTAGVLIDTIGSNPFCAADMAPLRALAAAAAAEPVLVLAAGGDVAETADAVAAFAEIGVKRIIVTKIDTTRRLGAVIAAADTSKLALADASLSPRIADGLQPLAPGELARILIHHPLSAADRIMATGTHA